MSLSPKHPLHGIRRAADTRLSAEQAGYMELSGAKKDADCHKVKVAGGVSTHRGCCNKFEPEKRTCDGFRCGNCEYVRIGNAA